MSLLQPQNGAFSQVFSPERGFQPESTHPPRTPPPKWHKMDARHDDKRRTVNKALVVVAVEENGAGIGRIRFRQIPDASAATLNQFLRDSVGTGSVVRTDGWRGYQKVESVGYEHEVIILKTKKEEASELLPRVHLVISLLKRWLMGTHQGAVSHKHLDYYLDEFTFRFNRRKSLNRGKLFYRLIQQAVAIEPVTLDMILHSNDEPVGKLIHGKSPAKEHGFANST